MLREGGKGGGALLRVRVTPKGGRDVIDGPGADAAGLAHMKVRVSAAPENGAANAAVLKLLAKALKLPKSSLSVESGETSRVKIIRIDMPVDTVRQALGVA